MAGPSVTFVQTDAPQLQLVNPAAGEYTFQLTVTDQDGLTASAQTRIKVVQNTGSVQTVADFLSNDFSGTVISDEVQTTSANVTITRAQANGELTLDFSGLDQFEKPYILTIKDGYSLDLSESSRLTLRAKSDVEIRLRAKLIDLDNRQVDNFAFDITIAGDNTFRTYTENFAGNFGSVDPTRIKTLELMSTRSGSFTGRLVLDDLNLGNKPPISVTAFSIAEDSISILPGSTYQIVNQIIPASADDQVIFWSSSNTQVASVSASGLLSSLLEGNATIVGTTSDGGFTDTLFVTVDDPSLNTAVLTPLDDAYVRGGTNTGVNYNTNILRVKDSDPNFDRIALLKFATTDTQDLISAKLRVHLGAVQNNSSATAAIYEITDNNWVEETVTWNDGIHTAKGALLDQLTVQQTGVYYEFDVTEYLIAAGRDTLSFSINDFPKSDLNIDFSSKENPNGQTPQLLIFTSTTGSIPVASLNLSTEALSLDKGDSVTVPVQILPSTATDQTVTWFSSNTAIASVNSNGTIVGLNLGTVDVIATSGNASDTVTVTVVPAIPTNTFVINPTDDVYVRGGNSASTNFGSDPSLLMKEDNSLSFRRLSYLKFSIADLENVRSATLRVHGQITLQGSGDNVRVLSAATDVWSENTMNYNTRVGAGTELDVQPITTTDQYYEWDVTDFIKTEIDNDDLASFIMLAQTSGSIFTFKSKENTSGLAPQLVVVTDADIVPVTGIAVAQDSLSLAVGETALLTPTFLPDSATDQNVFWSSSNPAAITVNAFGQVEAVDLGSAIITAVSNDGGFSDSVFVSTPVDDLALTSFCSTQPDSTRLWRVRNTNGFDVNYTWEIYGTSQAGSGVAVSGDSFFTSLTEGGNTLKLYWFDETGYQKSKVKASIGGTAEPVLPLLNSQGNPTNPRLLLDRDKDKQSDTTHHIKLRGFNKEPRIVVVSEAPIMGTPVDGLAYDYDLRFGLGDTLATGEFVVQNNTKSYNDFTMQGLTGNTTYYVAVFIYNNGAACGANYIQQALATGSFTTKPATSGARLADMEAEVSGFVNSVLIYPNPAQNVANIRVSSEKDASGSIRIISLSGQVAITQPLEMEAGISDIAIDIARLKAGIYIVQVQNEDMVTNHRLVITE